MRPTRTTMTDAELRRRAVEPAKDHPWRPTKLPTTPGAGTSLYRPGSALVARLNARPHEMQPYPMPSQTMSEAMAVKRGRATR